MRVSGLSKVFSTMYSLKVFWTFKLGFWAKFGYLSLDSPLFFVN